MLWCDMIWYDMIYSDMIWYHIIWHDIFWYDMIPHNMTWYIMLQYDIGDVSCCDNMSYIMIRFKMIWYDPIWYDMMWFGIFLISLKFLLFLILQYDPGSVQEKAFLDASNVAQKVLSAELSNFEELMVPADFKRAIPADYNSLPRLLGKWVIIERRRTEGQEKGKVTVEKEQRGKGERLGNQKRIKDVKNDK